MITSRSLVHLLLALALPLGLLTFGPGVGDAAAAPAAAADRVTRISATAPTTPRAAAAVPVAAAAAVATTAAVGSAPARSSVRTEAAGAATAALAAGCVAVPLTTWGNAPGEQAAPRTVPDTAECFELTVAAASGFAVRLGYSSAYGWSPQVTVTDGTGAEVWSGSVTAESTPVVALPAGTFQVLVDGADQSAPSTYRFGVYDVLAAGCSALPSTAWDAELVAVDVEYGALDCRAVGNPAGDAVRIEGAVATQLVDAQGALMCSTLARDLPTTCELTGPAPYRLLSSLGEDDPNPVKRARVVDLGSTAGCATLPSTGWDAANDVQLAAGGVYCRNVPDAAGDRLRLQLGEHGAGARAVAAVVDAAGVTVCDVPGLQPVSCTLAGPAPHRVLVNAPPRTSVGEHTGAVDARLHLADATSTSGCTTMPIASWGAALPGTGTDGAGDWSPHCFAFTTQGAGAHLLSRWHERRGSSITTELWQLTADLAEAGRPRTLALDPLATSSLAAGETYLVVLSDEFRPWGDPPTGTYAVGVFDLVRSAGCVMVEDLAWTSPRHSGSLANGELDCHEVAAPAGTSIVSQFSSAAAAGFRGGVFNSAGRMPVFQGSATGCGIELRVNQCPLRNDGPFRVLLSQNLWQPPADYDLWLNRVDGAGCAAVEPAVLTTGLHLESTLAPGERRCTFVSSSTFGQLTPPMLVTAEGDGAQLAVFTTVGEVECQNDDLHELVDCTLPKRGARRVLVTNTGSADASYRARLLAVPRPEDCTAINDIGFGFGPLSGTVRSPLDSRCFTFVAAAGDKLTMAREGLDGTNPPSLHVFDPSEHASPFGTPICAKVWTRPWQDAATCSIPRTGAYVAVVTGDSTSTGRFELSAVCQDPACGADELLVAGTRPAEVANEEVTVTFRGRHFDPSYTYSLVRDGLEVEGTAPVVSEDRKTARVMFDLTEAGLGAWTAKVRTPAGLTKLSAASVMVATAKPPAVTASFGGESPYRPGMASRATMTITNDSNSDAVGVPVIVTGFPAGSLADPQMEVTGLDASGNPVTAEITEDDMFVRDGDGRLGLPLIVNRIPAGGETTLDLVFQTDVSTTQFQVQTRVGECWGGADEEAEGSECLNSLATTLADMAFDFVPGAACIALARDTIQTAVDNWSTRGSAFSFGSWSDVLSFGVSAAFGAVDCATDLFPASKAIKLLAEAGEKAGQVWTWGSIGVTCLDEAMNTTFRLIQSSDPNEIIGPPGGGADRAFRPEGRQRYSVYFENKAEATAAAQVVTVDTDLDAGLFDLSTLTFGAVSFGDTTWTPPPFADGLDHLIDVGSPDYQVQVKATKADDGDLAWRLTTIDPGTGKQTLDPVVGFLPPNVDGSEGQGVVHFDVAYVDGLADGTAIPAVASIVFDVNDPIVTNTWLNTVDTDLPSVQVDAPVTTSATEFEVTWNATDPTSAVTDVQLYRSVDGSPFEPWQAGGATGSATVTAELGQSHAFKAIARDEAGNSSVLPAEPQATTDVIAGSVTFTRPPGLVGTPAVGSLLQVLVSTDPAGAATTVVWTRDGKPIAGATGTSYRLVPADLGRRVGADVRATSPGLGDATQTLVGQVVTRGVIRLSRRVAVKGKARVGKRLKAAVVLASPVPTGVRVRYRWLRNGKAIRGASQRVYRVVGKDRRRKISVRVVVTAPAYDTLRARSAAKRIR